MTLSNFIRCVSDEQPVSVTWTGRAGNDYTIYEGDAAPLKRKMPDFEDVHLLEVLEVNCTDDGVLWIGVRFAANSSAEWALEQVLGYIEWRKKT